MKQKPTLYLCILTSIVLVFSSCQDQAASKEHPPNILFIAVDDLRPELGAYGNEVVQTPNLDALADQGRLFQRHYVQVPTCGPSRHVLLTGKRPTQRAQLRNNVTAKLLPKQPADSGPETFIHQLRQNGYYTVGMGKISHSADGLVYGYNEEPSSQRELPNSWDELVFDAGKWETGWNAFFAYANGENRQSMNRQVKPYEKGNVNDEGYPDGLTAKLATEKLKELKQRDDPFFLGVGFFRPHLPFNAPKKYWDLYNREDISLSPNPSIPKGVSLKSLHGSGEFNGYHLTDEKAGLDGPVSDAYARKLRHAYYASISYVDAQIGKVLTELKNQGLDENTIVVVWGDHGWHLGDHLVWGKHTLFERSLKSALLIKTPRMKQPGVPTRGIVETVDIYPTLMELCGLDAPKDLDGKSFVNQLQSPDAAGNRAAYGYFWKGVTVRTDRYRLTKYYRNEEPVIELYDHQKDPFETINVAGKHPDVVEKLLPILDKENTGIYE